MKTRAIAKYTSPFLTVLSLSFSRSLSRRYDHLDIWRRRGIIHHPQSVGAGRADILDIVARREEGRRDRDTARERAHDHLDQCSARVREARSRGQQGVRPTFCLAYNTFDFVTCLVRNFPWGIYKIWIDGSH